MKYFPLQLSPQRCSSYLTCEICGWETLPEGVAGCHLSAVRVKVGHRAGEFGAAAHLDAACLRHLVHCVPGGEHWCLPGQLGHLAVTSVCHVLWRAGDWERNKTQYQYTISFIHSFTQSLYLHISIQCHDWLLWSGQLRTGQKYQVYGLGLG